MNSFQPTEAELNHPLLLKMEHKFAHSGVVMTEQFRNEFIQQHIRQTVTQDELNHPLMLEMEHTFAHSGVVMTEQFRHEFIEQRIRQVA